MKTIALLTSLLLILGLAPSAFAEEDKVACPTEFDPYDPVWVLVRAELDKEYFSWDRYFFYQPDPALRIQRKIAETCRGFTTSFLVEGREQLTLKIIYKGKKYLIPFLRNEEGEWIPGTKVWNTEAEKLVAGGELILRLYQEEKIVAVRIVPVPADYDWKAIKAEKEKREKEEK